MQNRIDQYLYHQILVKKMVHDRLYMFLEQNSTFYNYQFGFIDNHSNNHTLIEITEKIRNACDKNLFSCEVYLHLQKVFDTVNHGILLTKLKHYGIRGTSYEWFQSFLCDRLQYIMESHKALSLDLYCLSYTSMTYTIQLRITKYITMRMTLIYC